MEWVGPRLAHLVTMHGFTATALSYVVAVVGNYNVEFTGIAICWLKRFGASTCKALISTPIV